MRRMTVEVGKRISTAGLSRRGIARRLGTSVPELYPLLDPANTSTSINQLISPLHVLGCAVDLKVRRRRAAASESPLPVLNPTAQQRKPFVSASHSVVAFKIWCSVLDSAPNVSRETLLPST